MLEQIWLFINTHTPLLYLTQPIWRDEAFSVLIALNTPLEILRISVNDFGFPLFYLILHYWINLFGYSEIAIRLLPFTFHLLTIYVAYILYGHFIKNLLARANPSLAVKFQIATAILIAINPMLVYYAFEARTYSLLALMATASMYAFYTQRRWLYVIVSTLGLYSHYFFVLIILTQVIYIFITKFQIPNSKFQFSKYKTVWNLVLGVWDLFRKNIYLFLPFLLFLPWLPILIRQILASSETWRYPIDRDLWLAAIGNIFTGYSGNPVAFLRYVQLISFAVLASSLIVLLHNTKDTILIFLWMILPILTILCASFLMPLWVNRYLIFVGVAEIFLIMFFIYYLPKKFQMLVYLIILGLVVVFNIWFVRYQKKTDFRTQLTILKHHLLSTDVVVVSDPLILFETRYYLLDSTNQVKLYNPENKHIPNYLGTAIIERDNIITKLPRDRKVYLVNKDGSITKISN